SPAASRSAATWSTPTRSPLVEHSRAVARSALDPGRACCLAPGGLGFGQGLQELFWVEVGRGAGHLRTEPLGQLPAEPAPGRGVQLPAALEEPPDGDELERGDAAHVPGGVAVGDGEIGA